MRLVRGFKVSEKGRECTRCRMFKPWARFHAQPKCVNGRSSICRKCRRIEAKRYYVRNRKKILAPCALRAERCRAGRVRVRNAAIAAYGGVCACCGEATPEFLVLDHIYGGGEKHRLSMGCKTGGSIFYAKLKRQGWPFRDQLRVLCHNCNSSYGYYGYCPHHTDRKTPA